MPKASALCSSLLNRKYFLLFLVLVVNVLASSLIKDVGGDEEIRTPDPLLARQVLSQLSYTPIQVKKGALFSPKQMMLITLRLFSFLSLLRKEVIQPHLPIRLPCYDFTPVIGFALGSIFTNRLRAPPTSMV